MLGCEKTFFLQKLKKQLDVGPVLRWLLPPPNPVFYNEFARFLNATKCTFGVHVGFIWDPHVPKTRLFTMNFNDFRGVVFVAPNEPRRSLG